MSAPSIRALVEDVIVRLQPLSHVVCIQNSHLKRKMMYVRLRAHSTEIYQDFIIYHSLFSNQKGNILTFLKGFKKVFPHLWTLGDGHWTQQLYVSPGYSKYQSTAIWGCWDWTNGSSIRQISSHRSTDRVRRQEWCQMLATGEFMRYKIV